nr:VCBS repeat-containing protein [Terriglobales bacterium]
MRLCAAALSFYFLLLVAGAAQAATADRLTEAARVNNRGAAYMNQQLFDRALADFQHAAAMAPALQIAGLNQGVALLNLGKIDAARPLLQDAVKSRADDPHAWYNLGLLYKNSGEDANAIHAFEQVTKIDPGDADTWYFLGSSYLQAKNSPQAVAAFERALGLSPLHASAQFGLARAYQQRKNEADARRHLQRFQYITQHKLGSPISLAYGEQGKYSLAEESPLAPMKVPAGIPVKFVDVTRSAGLTTKAEQAPRKDLAAYLGPGACFLDYDNDGLPDIFLPDNGSQGGMSLYHNAGKGHFDDRSLQSGIDPALHAIGCTAADYDNDGFTDLAISLRGRVLLLHNDRNGTFKDVTASAGIKSDGLNAGVTFIDYDHDGDLDLYISRYSDNASLDPRRRDVGSADAKVGRNLMWRNNGNGTFTEVAHDIAVEGQSPTLNAVGTDWNNDRAIDLALSQANEPLTLIENPREGRWETHNFGSADLGDFASITTLDFNHDGWMDIVSTHWNGAGLALWKNNQGKSYERVSLPSLAWKAGWGVAALDYDNDGWVDLAAVGETQEGKGEVRLLRNLGPDGFKDVTVEIGLDQVHLTSPRALVTADFDNDGDSDLLITQNGGPAVLLRNDGGNQNHWLKLSLKGLADNKSAIGTKVEVFSDGNQQKVEVAGSSGYLGQNSPDFIVGLGHSQQADVVRMLWPTGVLQDEIEVPSNTRQNYTELDRRGSSCPTLFAWDGKRYRFVADMLGAGVVGHWVAPGQRNIPRPTEYIKLPPVPTSEDGRLSFRFMEPLEEAVYLDRVRLIAVDHPAHLEVFPNEYFASNPPFPPFKVVFSDSAQPPAGARDEHGHDLLPALQHHEYVGDFGLLPFAGFAKPHSLELDLGQPYDGGPLWMLAHGEIEYFSASSMYAADQAGLTPTAPYVEALVDGRWIRVLDDLGFPAGGPRTMTADLTGKLPVGTQHIRLSTNLQIYWDSILFTRLAQQQPARITEVPLSQAALAYHGFPRKIENQPPGNVEYVFEQASATGPYTRPAGAYTRYGDVLPLLTSVDDRSAVFGSGDALALEFDSRQLPA